MIELIVVLIVLGVLMYLVNSAPFIDARMKPWITWVIVAIALLYAVAFLLSLVGMVQMPAPRLIR